MKTGFSKISGDEGYARFLKRALHLFIHACSFFSLTTYVSELPLGT